MCTLDLLKTGETGRIISLKGGNHFISRITAMGFTPETKIKMISNRGRGPIIVFLRDTMVALGRGETLKISVKAGAV